MFSADKLIEIFASILSNVIPLKGIASQTRYGIKRMLHVNKCVQEVTQVFNWLLATIKSKNGEQILDNEELGNEKQG